ncbi:hypothetical protein AS148_12360 [Achromobacter xylosoxidans]|nr:hypothetical protein AS148_12360 [Achromobacter xylosoxidans]CUR78808.1 Poly-beta-1,6-N-acetyl-D-glucosamine synthase [Achromobacter xylosoxidans]
MSSYPTSDMDASIIVLAYNHLDETTAPCLDSILEHTDLSRNELIVVDNASSDSTAEYLREFQRQHPKVQLCLNDVNKGYAGGNNDGMRLASGRVVILLNNDTLVGPGWLAPLVNALEQDPGVGMVGPVTNSAGNEQRIVLADVTPDTFISATTSYLAQQQGIYSETAKLGFFCVAIRRDVIDKIGMLDEAFGIGMFEDDDLCVRAINAGYRLLIAEGAFVYHKGSVSFSKLGTEKYQGLFFKNLAYFFEKHNTAWTYTDISIAAWKRLKQDTQRALEGDRAAAARVRARASLMDDTLSQARRQEEAAMQSSSSELSNRIAAKKHAELMELSNWATSLKVENERLSLALHEQERRSGIAATSDPGIMPAAGSLVRAVGRKIKRLLGA